MKMFVLGEPNPADPNLLCIRGRDWVWNLDTRTMAPGEATAVPADPVEVEKSPVPPVKVEEKPKPARRPRKPRATRAPKPDPEQEKVAIVASSEAETPLDLP